MKCIVEQTLCVGVRGAESFEDLLENLIRESDGIFASANGLNLKLSELPNNVGVRATWGNSFANFYEDTAENRAMLGL
jgi:hypothetical protein